MEKVEARERELLEFRRVKEKEFSDLERIAKEKDGAPSSKMIADHHKALQDMDRQRDEEKSRLMAAQEQSHTEFRRDFENNMSTAEMALVSRQLMAAERIDNIHREAITKLQSREAEWQLTVSFLDYACSHIFSSHSPF